MRQLFTDTGPALLSLCFGVRFPLIFRIIWQHAAEVVLQIVSLIARPRRAANFACFEINKATENHTFV